MSIKKIVLESVDSTNTYAKSMLGESDRFVVLAKHQSAGRGRMGRSFLGEGGIYMSYARRSDLPLSSTVSVTTACAVAVCLALEKYSGKRLGIKWVNDIYLGDKKVCGILTEAVTVGGECGIVVGIGINAGNTTLPDELSEIAGCIDIPEDKREELVDDIIAGLESFFESPEDHSYMTEYRERLLYLGRHVRAVRDGGDVIGVLIDVEDDGALLLQTDSSCEPVRIFSGEVTLRKL